MLPQKWILSLFTQFRTTSQGRAPHVSMANRGLARFKVRPLDEAHIGAI